MSDQCICPEVWTGPAGKVMATYSLCPIHGPALVRQLERKCWMKPKLRLIQGGGDEPSADETSASRPPPEIPPAS